MKSTVDHERCFGDLLRREREQRGITLELISASTKVMVRNLKALEEERFDQLPGGILGKGIVRGYVRCLGLDENEWVRRYLDAQPQPETPPDALKQNPQDWASFALNISHNRIPSEHSAQLRWTGVGVLLLMLASFGWFVWSYLHTRTASAQTSTANVSYTAPNSLPAAAPVVGIAPKKENTKQGKTPARHRTNHRDATQPTAAPLDSVPLDTTQPDTTAVDATSLSP